MTFLVRCWRPEIKRGDRNMLALNNLHGYQRNVSYFEQTQGGFTIGDRQIHGLIVQCSKLIATFWSRRPDFFGHLGLLSQSDWVGGQRQWQHGRPHQVYQEYVQKGTWHRKKVESIMVESVRPFSEPQEGRHQEWQADRPQQDCQKYVVKLRVLSHSLITPGKVHETSRVDPEI